MGMDEPLNVPTIKTRKTPTEEDSKHPLLMIPAMIKNGVKNAMRSLRLVTRFIITILW